jgi:glycosyltransferase involved in cell wall biosynthesis
MKKVLFVGNVGLVINSFIKDYIIELGKTYDVYLLYNHNTEPRPLIFPDNIKLIHYEIERKLNVSDILFLFFLVKYIRKNKFDVTISITPKVGFLANLASFFSGVPVRIHFFTGQIWINLSGYKRVILKMLDKLLFSLTSHRFVDSPTQLSFLRSEGFQVQLNTYTVEYGSICGIDTTRFYRNYTFRESIRSNYNFSDKIVLLYVGRLDAEKGLKDLLEAFEIINRDDVCLLLVGPDEMNINKTIEKYKSSERIIYAGMTKQPEMFFSAGDIFCYVSYREGFGLSVIEASACQLPVIGTDIVGLRDAISHDVTGILVEPQNYIQLINAITLLVDNEDLRSTMGEKGRLHVLERFSKDFVQRGYISLLKKIIS